MKVPVSYTGRTQPSAQGLAGIRAPQQAADPIGPSLERVGAALSVYAEKVQAQDRFSVMRDMSDWEQRLNEEITTMRRQSPLDDANYFEQANAVLDSREAEFLNKIPAHLQPEFVSRTRDMVNKYRQQELEFGIKKKDAWFENGIEKGRELRKLDVSRDVSQLEAIRQRDREEVLSSGLSEAAKAAQLQKGDIELERVGYRVRVREELNSENLGMEDARSYVDKVIGKESGNRADAKAATSSAFGYAQVIDGTWRDFIKARHPELLQDEYLKYRSDRRLAEEFVVWYGVENGEAMKRAGVPVNHGTLYLAHFAGPQGAINTYNAPPNTPIRQILGDKVVAANKFLEGKTAGWLVDWAYKKMGRDTQYARTDFDPSFQNLPYEDRVSIREDVQRQLANEMKAATKAADDARALQENNVMLALEDGLAGRPQIDAARQSGLFKDYDQYRKALSIVERKEKEDADYRYIVGKLTNPNSIFSPDDTDDKKGANAWFEKNGGQRALEQKAPGAIVALNNFAQQTGIIPEKAMNILNAMTQTKDWGRAQYAYDILSQMRLTAPAAFSGATTDEEAGRVLLYDTLKGSQGAEDLQRILQPAQDTAEIVRRKTLFDQSEKLVQEIDAKDVFSHFTSYFKFGESYSLQPGTEGQLLSDFTQLFRQNYARIGDEDVAKTVTFGQLERNWGFSEAGGGFRFMKYPPEKVYPQFDGAYEYIDSQVRQEYGLQEDTKFQLLADARTEREVLNKRVGVDVTPSYRVVRQDENGILQALPDRMTFQIDAKMREKLFVRREVARLEQELRDAQRELDGAYQMRGVTQEQIPAEVTGKVKGLEQELARTRAALAALEIPRGKIYMNNPDGTRVEVPRNVYGR